MNTPQDPASKKTDAEPRAGSRPTWVRPRLVSYGPISKLTQGSSGSKSDGLTSWKPPCL